MNVAERNELVLANLPLVGFLVSDLCRRADHLSREDLASVGAIALMTAAEHYDPAYGVPFGAFARRRIIGSLSDELRSQDWASRTTRRRIKEVRAVQASLTEALGRAPKVEEVAEAMGVDAATARLALDDSGRSVEALEDSTYERIVFDGPTPEEELLTSERIQMVRDAVAALPERLRSVVEQIYFEGRSVKEIAEETGLTHSAVSHARISAIRLLRDGLEAHYPDGEPAGGETFHSKMSDARRQEYLDSFGRRAVGGITRAASSADERLVKVS